MTNMIITITTILPRKKAWSTLMFSCELVSTIGINPLNSFRFTWRQDLFQRFGYLDFWIFDVYERFGCFLFTWARSFSEIWISMIIINTISTVSIGSLQFLTSYQSLGLPHKYVVALISFGGDLVTPCIISNIYLYVNYFTLTLPYSSSACL